MATIPALEQLSLETGDGLFPRARSPRGARAGLLLHYGRWDEAHSVAQDLATPEGSFWHGIIHRLEPDPGNAAYWFRRAGRHAVFPSLREVVREIEARYPGCRLKMGHEWDPYAWIDLWESVGRDKGSDAWRMAAEIDRAEWRILYQYCVNPVE